MEYHRGVPIYGMKYEIANYRFYKISQNLRQSISGSLVLDRPDESKSIPCYGW